jgi:hypothetical protein
MDAILCDVHEVSKLVLHILHILQEQGRLPLQNVFSAKNIVKTADKSTVYDTVHLWVAAVCVLCTLATFALRTRCLRLKTVRCGIPTPPQLNWCTPVA